MTIVQRALMQKLYGDDIWAGYRTSAAAGTEVHGWNGNHPSLRRLAAVPGSEKIVVDVGVWKGQSTITMAAAIRRSEINGCVIAVDTFLGSAEHWNRKLFKREHGMPDLYRVFLDNVFLAGLQEYIIPLPQTSITAAAILRKTGITPSLVHVDAAHAYEEVIRDVSDYWELLQPGGIIVGDDYHESWPGVVRAAGEFSARVGRPLRIEPPKWIMQKP